MAETPRLYYTLETADEWIRKLFFYDSLGMFGTAAPFFTKESSREIKSTAALISKALEACMMGLRVEDVGGSAGSYKLLKHSAKEYSRPEKKTHQAHFAGTMASLAFRELSRAGRVSYNSFSHRATQPNDEIGKVETVWTFNENTQNLIVRLERLHQSFQFLMLNPSLVVSHPMMALRTGHVLSAMTDMMGRRSDFGRQVIVRDPRETE